MTEPDPWAAARERQRADVAAVLAQRDWTCARCGHANPPARKECANCGAPRVERVRRFERVRNALIASTALLVLAAVAALVVVPGLQEDAADERAEQARAQASLEAAELERLERDIQPKTARVAPRRGEDPLALRERLVAAAERRITADAKARIRAGTMEGPVSATACEPMPRTETRRQAELDPALRTGRYDCVAYSRIVDLPELEGKARKGYLGQPFYAVIEFPRGRITWCKVTPRAGEGGKSLVSVVVPEPCRDPPGPG